MAHNNTLPKQIIGYTDKLTVRPGETVAFKISAEKSATCQAQLVRLVNGDIYSDRAEFKEIEIASPVNKKYEIHPQPIWNGSCIVVDNAQAIDELDAFTLVVGLMPTLLGAGVQHIVSRWDEQKKVGWSLQIDEQGHLQFFAANLQGQCARVTIEQSLTAKQWYRACLRVDWNKKTANICCRSLASAFSHDPGASYNAGGEICAALLAPTPFMMAAAFGGYDKAERPIPLGCYNGRLEAPVIYRGILSNTDLARVLDGERLETLRDEVIADWDFSRDIGTTHIVDRSASDLHGATHNMPLRAVKGSGWGGTTLEWPNAPDQYNAIHFHDDDLYDCGWSTDITYTVPDDLRSGVYALRLRLPEHEKSSSLAYEEYLPFFVAAAKGNPQSKLAFMFPTYSYLAYANIGNASYKFEPTNLEEKELIEGISRLQRIVGNGVKERAVQTEGHHRIGASVYDRHTDGSPVHFSSWLRPLFSMRPKHVLWGLSADLLTIDWLEKKGFQYDIITDDLVEAEGCSVLSEYRAVISGNHPEYATGGQLDAIQSFTDHGGRFIYMGGNGYWWRIAVSDQILGVIEARRGRVGTSPWHSDVGEASLQLSGEPGGSWRELGRPPQLQFGVGFIAEGDAPSHYKIMAEVRNGRAAFILKGVSEDLIGDFGIFGGAAGQEIDQSNAERGTPAHAVVVARSQNHGDDMLYAVEEMVSVLPVIDYYRPFTYADVVFFETGDGGAVFSVGSMAWCGSLGENDCDNNISMITSNVLNRFLDVEPFSVPHEDGQIG